MIFPLVLFSAEKTSSTLIKEKIEIKELKKDLNSFYIAFEKHEPLKEAEGNRHITEAVGVYMVKMNYPNLDMKTLKYYDYKTTPRDGIFYSLMDQLPEDYQFLIEHP